MFNWFLKLEKPYSKNPSSSQTCDIKKSEEVGDNKCEMLAQWANYAEVTNMDLRWQHAMSNITKYKTLIKRRYAFSNALSGVWWWVMGG